ncbi:bacillithiol biosynthesis deacetylase BshB1 [Metabacillus sp. KIGAM252]|uniref:Bacillithiol biosynthesis deacetylase BshB1 n=1 Tax=Metabacillus flavus TaxID=2823519 RepID=A0ABS5LF56_9BACI|nr:bacillithiol biosynthesis deacetylase BshB1 [Metabacillus flavus]MBS2969385.1 bacillithiol biosynthesis deacetylase BshB1 [Metabacillus flavus]
MSLEKLDILAFGPHPGDVEYGMGGTLARYANKQIRTGICDLTEAELSSNGAVAERKKEATAASKVLGVKKRIFLDLPDRGLFITPSYVDRLISVIRKYRPDVVYCPAGDPENPDLESCANLVKEAIYSAGIHKYEDSFLLPAHTVNRIYQYVTAPFQKPDMIIDISGTISRKEESLRAYESCSNHTYIDPAFNREQLAGKAAGLAFAEGFISPIPIEMNELPGENK